MASEDYMAACLIKENFGFECLGCGAQRAFWLLMQGDFKEAFHMYPAIYSLLVLLFVAILSFFDKKRSYKKVLIFLGILNFVIILVSYYLKHPDYFQ